MLSTSFYDLLIGGRVETGAKVKGSQGYEMEGLRGLKALGVRDLSYKLAYLACTVTPTNARVRTENCISRQVVSFPNIRAHNSCHFVQSY